MMLYLVLVEKKKFLLLAIKQGEIWQMLSQPEAIASPYSSFLAPAKPHLPHLKDESLAIVEVVNKQVVSCKPAVDDLLAYLRRVATIDRQYKKQWREIELWKESLQAQAAELQRREDEINSREWQY